MFNITNDGMLDIATGRNRKETNWKNKEMAWSALLEKLSTTHRTAESHSEYLTAKKSRQDEIKDIGGFVGGFIANGRRKSGAVVHRQLLTLDMDFAEPASWDDFTMLYSNAAAVYSTHKHSSDAPRLRLVIPLDREVFADEYVAIARRVAGVIGIELFDPTTYQPERLMYWPSTSKDGEYLFEYQDGPWLSADEVLNSYRDWKDSSEWPISDRENNVAVRAIKKQGDPLEKPGVIGAFCRTYTISEVIETYLADVYEACDIENRYTYKEGSTAAGLVVYDDKYAYSHHGTDPVSGKLCNAFDLVRIHKYGLKDEDAREGTPGNKMPSYVEMVALATKDSKVRKQIGVERIQESMSDFQTGVEVDDEEPQNDDWLSELDVDRKGNYYSTIENIILILNNDPAIKNRFALNLFEHREIAKKDLPWRKVTHNTQYLTDKDDSGVRHYLEKKYSITGVQKISDAMAMVMMNNSFHPVKQYLDSVEWDGESRAETLLIDYLGAADTEYVRTVTKKILAAAVSRIFKPGCKFDYVLVLVGKQGLKKSSFIDKIGREWFSDSFSTVQGKEAFEQIQGVWLVEMGELAGLKKAEVETIKHFISKREDRYRVAYGRRIENFPRQCVFFATTNNKDFLRDPTGNRRFWPVDVNETEPEKDVFKDLTEYEIGQIWAEAVELYKAGEPLYLSKELEDQAFKAQIEHSEKDDRAGAIQRYLDTLVPENWDSMNIYDRRSFLSGDALFGEGKMIRNRVCIAEIWCELFGSQAKDMSSYNTKGIHDIMSNMPGWERSKGNRNFSLYGEQKTYIRSKTKTKSVFLNYEKVTNASRN